MFFFSDDAVIDFIDLPILRTRLTGWTRVVIRAGNVFLIVEGGSTLPGRGETWIQGWSIFYGRRTHVPIFKKICLCSATTHRRQSFTKTVPSVPTQPKSPDIILTGNVFLGDVILLPIQYYFM